MNEKHSHVNSLQVQQELYEYRVSCVRIYLLCTDNSNTISHKAEFDFVKQLPVADLRQPYWSVFFSDKEVLRQIQWSVQKNWHRHNFDIRVDKNAKSDTHNQSN